MTEDAVAAIIEKTHRGTSSISLREAAREILFLSAADTSARSDLARDESPSSKTPHPSASSEQSSDGWRTIESAPLRTVVLAWSGGVRLMTLDDLGQWRNLLGRPKQPPVAWMPLPNPPGEPS